MSNHLPDKNRPGYEEGGRWIGYHRWGEKMESGRGIGGVIAILLLIGICYLIVLPQIKKVEAREKNSEIRKEKALEKEYLNSNFFFPELDTITIFRTQKGENPILEKYSKYGNKWRSEFYKDYNTTSPKLFDDLIDGTYDYLEKDGRLTVKELKQKRFRSAQTIELYQKIKIGYLQEAKRVLEDNETYPWNGESKYLLYNPEYLKRKKDNQEYILELAIILTTPNLYSCFFIIGLFTNFLGRCFKKKKLWKIIRKIGLVLWVGSLIGIFIKVFL